MEKNIRRKTARIPGRTAISSKMARNSPTDWLPLESRIKEGKDHTMLSFG